MCAARLHDAALDEIGELLRYDDVRTYVSEKWTLVREARRAHRLYDKAKHKATKRPAPHGYGDGFHECMCNRCERSMRLEIAVQEAYAAWMVARDLAAS